MVNKTTCEKPLTFLKKKLKKLEKLLKANFILTRICRPQMPVETFFGCFLKPCESYMQEFEVAQKSF